MHIYWPVGRIYRRLVGAGEVKEARSTGGAIAREVGRRVCTDGGGDKRASICLESPRKMPVEGPRRSRKRDEDFFPKIQSAPAASLLFECGISVWPARSSLSRDESINKGIRR